MVLRQHRKSQATNSQRSNRKLHSEMTPVTPTKKVMIIQLKRNNPHLNLREIGDLVHANYGYARNVWAKYVRKEVTKKGSLSRGVPFNVHGWFYRDKLRTREYAACPVGPCNRRNGQKVWRGCRVVYLIHKGGDVFVYPLFDGWDRELELWLCTWLDPEFADIHLETLKGNVCGRKSYAAHTPGQIPKVRFNLKGIGKFITDPTPWPDGTTEIEVDPFIAKELQERLGQIDKRIQGVNYSVRVLADQIKGLVGELHGLVELLKGGRVLPGRPELSNQDRLVV